MNASVELSFYPLEEGYKDRIRSFIDRLKEHTDLRIEVNGMSSQVFGDYDLIMDALKEEIRIELQNHRSMFVMKIGDGIMSRENLPDDLR